MRVHQSDLLKKAPRLKMGADGLPWDLMLLGLWYLDGEQAVTDVLDSLCPAWWDG